MPRYARGERTPGFDRMVDILDTIGYDMVFRKKDVPKPVIYADIDTENPAYNNQMLRADDHLIGNKGVGSHWRDKNGPLE